MWVIRRTKRCSPVHPRRRLVRREPSLSRAVRSQRRARRLTLLQSLRYLEIHLNLIMKRLSRRSLTLKCRVSIFSSTSRQRCIRKARHWIRSHWTKFRCQLPSRNTRLIRVRRGRWRFQTSNWATSWDSREINPLSLARQDRMMTPKLQTDFKQWLVTKKKAVRELSARCMTILKRIPMMQKT